jgi:serine/threonine-protein kinase
MASAGPLPSGAATQQNKTGLFAGLAAAVVLLVGGFLMFGGADPGGLVISVAGPGGKAVSGVSVLIDGEEKCADSACKISDLEPGSYVIKAVAEGYEEMAGKAYEVAAGEQKAINIELVAEAGGTGLKVSSKASGLSLTVDGKKIGTLPQEMTEIEPGEHEITIDGSPFIKTLTEKVNVKEGDILEFEPKLELKKGQVSIELDKSAKGAKVALVVNGKRRSLATTIKKAKSDTVKIDLPVDGKTYKITATRKGYEDFEEKIEFSVESPVKTVELTLVEEGSDEEEEEDEEEEDKPSTSPAPRPRPTGGTTAPRPAPKATPKPAASGAGKLNINSIPVSNVILDGRPLGSTPKVGVSVSAGPHTVVFIHPQHGRKVRQVNVSGGGVATAAVRFP